MDYHVAIKGVRQGPLSEEALRAMIGSREAAADDLCWRDGWDQWRSAAVVFPELFQGSGVLAHVHQEAAVHDVEALRREHLQHEVSVKSIGSLYLLGSALLMLAGILGLVGAAGADLSEPEAIANLVVSVIFILLSLFQGKVGLWLREVNPKARTPATILACIGLLGFPIGTIINIYVLYLLRSKKGAVVFSPAYQVAIAQTPHIKYKTPVLLWVFVGLLALLAIGAMVAAAMS